MSLCNCLVLLSAFVLVGGFQQQCEQADLTEETSCGTQNGCFSETEGRCLQKCKEQACAELEERKKMMEERKAQMEALEEKMKAGEPPADPSDPSIQPFDPYNRDGIGGGGVLFSCAVECLPQSDNPMKAFVMTRKCLRKRCETGERSRGKHVRFSTVKEFEDFLVIHKIDIKDFTFRVDLSEGTGKGKLGGSGEAKKKKASGQSKMPEEVRAKLEDMKREQVEKLALATQQKKVEYQAQKEKEQAEKKNKETQKNDEEQAAE